MDGVEGRTKEVERPMTVAELDAQRADTITDLRQRIHSILLEAKEPLGVGAIEAHIQKWRIEHNEPVDMLNTLDIRHAIAEMEDDGEVRFTVDRAVCLVRK